MPRVKKDCWEEQEFLRGSRGRLEEAGRKFPSLIERRPEIVDSLLWALAFYAWREDAAAMDRTINSHYILSILGCCRTASELARTTASIYNLLTDASAPVTDAAMGALW